MHILGAEITSLSCCAFTLMRLGQSLVFRSAWTTLLHNPGESLQTKSYLRAQEHQNWTLFE